MTTKPKLKYFDLKSAAEPIRYVLEYANIEYEDVRVAMDDWLKVKPSIPFGLLPVLEIKGKVINQSTAICRYFAKQAGLAGADYFESLQIDALTDTVVDLRTAFADYKWFSAEKDKPAKAEKLKKETIPLYFTQFEKILKDNDGYLVNGKLTYSDIFLAGMVPYFSTIIGFDVTQGYPLVNALVEKVNNLPRIKAWIARRPDTLF